VVIVENEDSLSEEMRGEMINKRVACVRASETDKHIVSVEGVTGRRRRR